MLLYMNTITGYDLANKKDETVTTLVTINADGSLSYNLDLTTKVSAKTNDIYLKSPMSLACSK